MNFRTLRNLLAAMGSSALVAGCWSGPISSSPIRTFRRRRFSVTTGSAVADARLPAPTDPTWWTVFRDPVLTDLETASPPPISTSGPRRCALAESRFQRGVVAAARIPVDQRRRQVHPRALQPERNCQPARPRFGPAGGGGIAISPINDYNTGFDASWELDLWGKVRRQVEAADAQVDRPPISAATRWCRVSRNWPGITSSLRGVQTQIKIANDNLKVGRDVLGAGAGAPAARAAERPRRRECRRPGRIRPRANSAAAAAGIRSTSTRSACCWISRPGHCGANSARAARAYRAAADSARHSVRTRRAAAPISAPPKTQLHAATANIGVAVGDFYPSVQLNGTVGFDALDIKQFYKASSLQ